MYQVFISSTFNDLKSERLEIVKTVLDYNCIPSGMEFFPATDENQWEYIKKIIFQSDFVLLILGGSYGSRDPTDNVSYTEKEYRYAQSINKPIMAFVRNNAGTEFIDGSNKSVDIEDYKKFVKDVKNEKLIGFWEDTNELKSAIGKSLFKRLSDTDAIGWVRSDWVDPELFRKNVELTKDNEELKKRILDMDTSDPAGIEDLSQGDDTIPIKYYVTYYKGDEWLREEGSPVSWNEILCSVRWKMMIGVNEVSLHEIVEHALLSKKFVSYGEGKCYIEGLEPFITTLKTQFHSLKIWSYDVETVESPFPYQEIVWKMTPYGIHKTSQTLAIKKE